MNADDRAAAYAFWKLVEHLQMRVDVQNIDQMILAGFCRNCLSKWYHVGASRAGLALTYDVACERVYGMPYNEWKKAYQSKASDEQLRLFEETKARHAQHEHAVIETISPNKPEECEPSTATAASEATDALSRKVPQPHQLLSDVCCDPVEDVGHRRCLVAQPEAAAVIRLGVLTVSDRASRGDYEDLSGPEVLRSMREYASLEGVRWRLQAMRSAVVADEASEITSALVDWSGADGVPCNLIFTTGGTGLSPRDVTPEATVALVDRQVPGIPEYIMREALKVQPLAALSRATAGVRGRTLIVNLPGRPQAVRQNLQILMPLLAHALSELIR